MFWGYSAAVDFQNELDNRENEEEPVNILIVGAGDARHILETISKYYRHKRQIKINFYVAEVLMELIARQMLLLLTAFEPSTMLGLKEKVHLWMEIYGNILVRPNTTKYISQKSQELNQTVTDFDYLKYRLPMVSLDLFKYKERDLLEVVFKFWSQENHDYNVIKHWDNRLRKSLGVRYDSRKGAYDWDYHMKLRERHQGERINSREYSKWRETGIAFAWLETEMSEKNLTLTNGIFQHQDRILHHGYLGDQVSAPYIAFGLDCEDEEMLKTQNGIHLKRSTDIMFRNLSRMFWEIENQTPYCHADEKDSINLGVVVTELTENIQKPVDLEEPSQKQQTDGLLKKEPKERDNYSSIPLPNFKITFFPPSTITDLPHKQKFKDFFDLIWISQNLMKKVSSDLFIMAKNEAIVLVENRNYVISLSKEEFDKTPSEIDSIMKLCSCEKVQTLDLNKDAYAKYKFKNKDRLDDNEHF